MSKILILQAYLFTSNGNMPSTTKEAKKIKNCRDRNTFLFAFYNLKLPGSKRTGLGWCGLLLFPATILKSKCVLMLIERSTDILI